MVETVFDHIKTSPPHIEFIVKVSIIEIYMEELRDLLSFKQGKKLKIRSGIEKGIFVENLTEVYVTNPQEVYRYLKMGNKNRSVGRTNMNVVSSRSHLMVNLSLH
jgi:kinesin family protein 5